MDPPHRSVRPMDPANSVSPENSSGASPAVSRYRQMDPGVWPGVWITRASRVPKASTSPPSSSRVSGAGGPGGGAMPNSAQLLGDVVVQEAVVLVQAGLGLVGAGHRAGGQHVIEVGVGVHHLHRLPVAGLQLLQDARRLVAGIDDQRLAGLGAGHQGAVAAQRADGERRAQQGGQRRSANFQRHAADHAAPRCRPCPPAAGWRRRSSARNARRRRPPADRPCSAPG